MEDRSGKRVAVGAIGVVESTDDGLAVLWRTALACRGGGLIN